MGLLADFFLSTDDKAVSYTGTDGWPPEDLLESKSITSLEITTLWAILKGVEWDVEIMDDVKTLFAEDDGSVVIERLPDEFVRTLASTADGDLQNAIAEWAGTEEVSANPAEIAPFVKDLQRLAKRSIDSGRAMYLWNCL